MAGKADYLENLLLNCLFRGGGNVTALATTYVALFTTNPADDGTGGTEVTGTGYARVAVTSSSGNWKDPSTATQGQISNTNNRNIINIYTGMDKNSLLNALRQAGVTANARARTIT